MGNGSVRLWIIIMIMALGVAIGSSLQVEAGGKARKPHELAIVHNNRGVTELYQGNAQRALFEFQTAVEIDPEYLEATTNLGVAYKLLGQYDEAKKSFERAIRLDKNYATAYNHLGTVYYTQGNYTQAISFLETATKRNKKLADAWLNLGLAYIALANEKGGDVTVLRKSIDPLRKATDIDTSYSRAHGELAKVYEKLGDIDKATIRYKLALESNNNSIDGWISLGKMYYDKEQLVQAKNAFTQAISLSPQSVEAHLYLGLTYLKEANYPLALAEFQNVLRIAPTSERAYFNIGYTYFLMAKQQQAAGNTETAQGNYRQALSAYAQAIQLNPNFADAAYNAGYTYGVMRDFANAEKWYKTALAADSAHYRSLVALGLLSQDQGRGKEANAYLCQVKSQFARHLTPQEKSIVENVTQSNGGCK